MAESESDEYPSTGYPKISAPADPKTSAPAYPKTITPEYPKTIAAGESAAHKSMQQPFRTDTQDDRRAPHPSKSKLLVNPHVKNVAPISRAPHPPPTPDQPTRIYPLQHADFQRDANVHRDTSQPRQTANSTHKPSLAHSSPPHSSPPPAPARSAKTSRPKGPPITSTQTQEATHTENYKTDNFKQEAPLQDWKALLSSSINNLERELYRKKKGKGGTAPGHSKQEAFLRLLYMVAENHDEAFQPIKQLNDSERDFWNNLMFALQTYFDEHANPSDERRKTAALLHLRRAAENLSEVSDLEVGNVALCSGVDSFGRYEEWEKYEFATGAELLLYVEVNNFSAEQSKDGDYETELLGSYEIRRQDQTKVWDHSFAVIKDTCRNRRRDFFIPYRMYIPNTLAPGEYTLQVTMQDTKTKRMGQSSPISFTVKPAN